PASSVLPPPHDSSRRAWPLQPLGRPRLLNLARRRAGKFVRLPEDDVRWHLVAREPLAAEFRERLRGGRRALPQLHRRRGDLALAAIPQADDVRLLHGWMREQYPLDLEAPDL